ncbi:MAG TPA: hypothetical protein VFM55_20255 [Micromonosporaceae bacterium]|nr:hypothetical protein [Micromonosporaceae bacterium]
MIDTGVADWDYLPQWQQDTYAAIFKRIERKLAGTRSLPTTRRRDVLDIHQHLVSALLVPDLPPA